MKPAHDTAWMGKTSTTRSQQFLLGLGLLSLLGLAQPKAIASDQDWYRWRGPDLNGISNEKDWLTQWPAEGPKQLWKAAVGLGYSSFSVSQGRLYTMGVVNKQETIWCLDAETGKEIWQQNYPYIFKPKYYRGGSSVTPTVDGDKVYSLGQGGELYCFEAATGKIAWSKNITDELGVKVGMWGLASSPVIENQLLLLNIGSHGTALDKVTGKVVWTTGKDAGGYSSAVPYTLNGKRELALLVAKAAVGVDLKTGREIWSYPWKTDWDVNAADPIVRGDQVFISAGYKHGGALLQLGQNPPKLIWENKNMQNMFNACVLIDGHLYGIDGDNDKKSYLRCVDWKTGDTKWTMNDFTAGALMGAGSKLIVMGTQGQLAVVEATPESSRIVSQAQVLGGECWTTPVLANGRIYCRNSKGDLVCLDVRRK